MNVHTENSDSNRDDSNSVWKRGVCVLGGQGVINWWVDLKGISLKRGEGEGEREGMKEDNLMKENK